MDKLFGSWWPWGRDTTTTTTTTTSPIITTKTTPAAPGGILTTPFINSNQINFKPTTSTSFRTSVATTEQHSSINSNRNVYNSLVNDDDDVDMKLIKSTTTEYFIETSSSSISTTSYLPSSSSSSTTEDFLSATDDELSYYSSSMSSPSSTSSSTTFSSLTDYVYDELNSTFDILNNLTNAFTTNHTTTGIGSGTQLSTNPIIGDEFQLHQYGGGVGGGSWNCTSLSDINCNNNFYEQNPFMSNESTFGVVIFSNFSNLTQGIRNNGAHIVDADNMDLFDDETTLHLVSMIMTAVVLAIIILATVIGNVFVIAAILLERNLQSVANYLILSLAVADLLVACLVMPLGAVYEVSQEWRLGPELCDMWTSSDVLCCTASILHLVCIALDRYWAVTNIDYVHQRTGRRIGIMILVVWGLSFLVSIAPLLGWKDPGWEIRLSNLQCIVSQDLGYQIFATTSSFYFPLLVILVLYWRIYQTARKRIRRRQQGKSIVQLMPKVPFAVQTHPEPLANASCLALTPIGFRWKVSGHQQQQAGMIATAAGGSGGIAAAVVAVIGRPLPTISETTTAFTNVSSTNTSPEKGSYGNGIERSIDNDPPTADLSVAYPSHGQPSLLRPPTITRKKTQNSADSKRERKAAKTLAIITGAFVCCWLPFFIVAILLPTCSSCDISPLIISFFLWLGYFNSTLNPIIYTIFSPEFRHAFKRILCGRRNSIRRRTGVRR